MPSRLTGDARKSLRGALLVSLSAHGLLLISQPEMLFLESGGLSKTLHARIAAVSRASSLPHQAPAQAVKQSPANQNVAVPAKAFSSPLLAEDSAATPVPLVSTEKGASSERSASHASPPQAYSGGVVDAPAPVAAVGAVEPSRIEGVFADDLRTYRVGLAVQARRFRTYPALALEQNLSGRVEVEVVLLPMSPPRFQLKRSSGYDVLDRAALDMLRRAAQAVDFPSSLRERGLTFVLPVEFVPPS